LTNPDPIALMMLSSPKPIGMSVSKGEQLINHFFLDVIGNIALELIIHLLARSEVDPYAMKRQTTASSSEVAATFAV